MCFVFALDFGVSVTNDSISFSVLGFWVWSRKTMQSWCICSQSFLILTPKSDNIKNGEQQHGVKCGSAQMNSDLHEHIYRPCNSRYSEGIVPGATAQCTEPIPISSSSTASTGYVVNKAYQFSKNCNHMQQPLLQTRPLYRQDATTSLD